MMVRTLSWLFPLVMVNCLFMACAAETKEAEEEVSAEDDADDSTHKNGDESYRPPIGDPITAEDLIWTWVGFPESKCRDGSSTGIGVSINSSSDKLMIYLEGGGACYNSLTCMANPASFSEANFTSLADGVFDRNNNDNPVKDWNHVYIPFCTGDVFLGDNVADPGIGEEQHFHGYKNMEMFLDRIVATFPDVTQVLSTGLSAGGFGCEGTAPLVARKFPPDVQLTLIGDSGPPMSGEYLDPCLMQGWREVWGFDNTLLAECGSACPDPNDYMVDLSLFLTDKFPDAVAGIVSGTSDSVIRMFYGFANNNCNPEEGIPSMPAETFQAGLLDFREKLKEFPNFNTYYVPGENHGWIRGPIFYETEVDGVRLVDWFRDIVEGNPPGHIGL